MENHHKLVIACAAGAGAAAMYTYNQYTQVQAGGSYTQVYIGAAATIAFIGIAWYTCKKKA